MKQYEKADNTDTDWFKVRGYPKKNSDTVHFCISQDGYPKRASQDYANDTRIIFQLR